jgi:oxygen-independent coproporphyrinogen-3 oxidase
MDQQLVFDPELVRKYDRPGPRYTSYPTAPNFTPAVGAAAYAAALRASNAGDSHGGPPADLSLYVHLPFCRHLCTFCGCTMVVRRDPARSFLYLDKLERELDRVAPLVARSRQVRQVHFGGGTPTFLPPAALDRLIRMLKARFSFADDAELGIEVHPNATRREHLEALAAHGWNRISVGIQDFDEEVQRAIRRVQPYELTRRVIEDARALGFRSVNADLIYGLPHQTVERFAATVATLLGLVPDRIACYNFAFLPERMRHQRLLPAGALPGPAEKLAILARAIRDLTAAGYVFIGFDHFARPDDELAAAQRAGTLHRNFQGYTTRRGLDLLAFGVSAISSVGRCYAQNAPGLAAYEAAAGAGQLATVRGVVMSDDDLLRRELIMELASQFRVRKRPLEERFGIDFDRTFAGALAALAPMAADGLVELFADRLEVTPRGRPLLRNLCMPFDAYLEGGRTLFSRTV